MGGWIPCALPALRARPVAPAPPEKKKLATCGGAAGVL
uniref:Uncharacterized protein n=1 Tax=Setaria viridis TaxID=4556 RepID=A0A4U6W2U8_SETVI|nr:hypothetical protein SEVIR_2G127850v2 [Setaria viridis]